MEANLFLLLASGVLVGCGVYLLLDRAMTKMVLGLLLIGNGANLLLLQAGGQAGSPPIDGRESHPYGEQIADPLAQAMILTAIVISMAATAVMLAMAALGRDDDTRSAEDVERVRREFRALDTVGRSALHIDEDSPQAQRRREREEDY